MSFLDPGRERFRAGSIGSIDELEPIDGLSEFLRGDGDLVRDVR